ncbi:MAG: hypothetical protein WD063_02695 [Pirellulales bacterium]
MSEPRLKLSLEDPRRAYRPGELLAAHFNVEAVAAGEVRAVELSVLWHTEGKGDEDMSVHFFERVEPSDEELVDFRQPRRFSTVLPNSPLSYSGMIVNIRWCVRARVFLARGKELARDAPFQLGALLPAERVET